MTTHQQIQSARLAALKANVKEWAATFVDLTAALEAEGMDPEEAKREAREAANMAAFLDEPNAETCPNCGEQGGELTSMGSPERLFSCRCGWRWARPLEEPEGTV